MFANVIKSEPTDLSGSGSSRSSAEKLTTELASRGEAPRKCCQQDDEGHDEDVVLDTEIDLDQFRIVPKDRLMDTFATNSALLEDLPINLQFRLVPHLFNNLSHFLSSKEHHE